MTASDFSLDRILAPVTPAEFFRDYYEIKTLLIRRTDPDYYSPLLSLAEIDRVITTLALNNDDIQMVNAKDPVKVEDYTYPSGMIDPVKLYQKFADGATVILPQLHLRVATLADLCRGLEREFSSRFQTNIYLTPGGNAQGFKPHFDNHDVLVLQVAGAKQWKIYDTPEVLPHRGHNFDPARYPAGPVTQDFTLHAGDMLYIPRGVMHDAVSTDQLSLHITVGVMSKTWTDFLLEAVSAASLTDPAFRNSLPAGFAREGFDRATAEQTFRSLLRTLVERAPFASVFDQHVDDLVNTRHALVWDQMDQVLALPELDLGTVVGARPNLIIRVERDDEQIRVSCYGKEVALPIHAAEPMLFALETRQFRVQDLPGELDDAGKLVLIRRLIREGLVRML